MNRRDFLASGVGAAVAAGVRFQDSKPALAKGAPFRLDYAPHFGQFKAHGDGARDEEQQLVAVGVHLAVVGRVARELGRADGVAVDAVRRATWLLLHEDGVAVGQREADHLAR